MNSLSLKDEMEIWKQASNIRKKIAMETAAEFLNEFNAEKALKQIKNSILNPLYERNPFQNTLEKLSFSLYLTEKSIDYVLQMEVEPIKKLSYANYIVEIGAREFISPFHPDKIEKNLTASKAYGYFFTPISLGTRMVKLALKDKPKNLKSIVDPACGIGSLLALALIYNPEIENVVGIELDSFTANISHKLLVRISKDLGITPKIKIINQNFLDYVLNYEEEHKEKFDLLIMNPPYGRVRFLKNSLTNKETKSGLTEGISELEKKLREETILNAADLRKKFASVGLGKGTPEYSKVFLAISTKIVKQNGYVIAITPSSWLGDESGRELRKYLVENHGISCIWNFKESAKLFSGVNQPTTVVKIKVNSNESKIEIQGPLSSLEELGRDIQYLDTCNIKKYSPEWYRIPQCGNERAKILSKLHNHAPLSSHKKIYNLRGELDLTSHKDLLSDNPNHWRLIRGDHVEKFNLKNPEESEKLGFVDHQLFIKRMGKSNKLRHIKNWRITLPQCSYMNKKKRIEACIVEPNNIIANSCNYITLEDCNELVDNLLLLCAIINSAVIEWRFRLFNSNNHVSNYEIDEFPIFKFDTETEMLTMLKGFLHKPIENWSKIEALIALMYGLNIEDMKVILNDLEYEDKDKILKYMDIYQEKFSNKDFIVYNHTLPTLSELDKEMISYVKQGGNWEDIPETVPSKRLEQIREMSKRRGKVRTTYYGRLNPNQPAYTISTYFNRPGNGTNIHPWENRTISCREAARLQSFPDSFIFYGKEGAVRKQIGNAVPPLLSYALGKTIKAKTFVDLFAGAGGLSYGFELAGLEGIAALEIDKDAAETYAKNHSSNIDVIVGDIRSPEIQNQLIESVKNKLKGRTLDLIAGGPPCQGFSTAGWRKPDDERNALVTYFLQVVQKLMPNYVLIENVEGLINMNKGLVLKSIHEVLDELGYIYYKNPWVLSAEQYGVPQMRKRVFIVAAKKGLELPKPPVQYFDKCLGRREKESDRKTDRYPVTVAEAFFGLPCLLSPVFTPPLEINPLYSQWCNNIITTEEFLNKRGKIKIEQEELDAPQLKVEQLEFTF
ncbi:Alw26I/Eco31I/Esp3I family type II restriction adenine-specific DNA-methyltransferase [Parageobacillus toebii]|uniref:Alw26I/Eco31I/Esp3I family type II restriction adenine-specific DNA-methyltransferase n=1 Tax=Parageobacillus toebii TaxID=153151 RepID=UPI0028151BE5|nr:Alw26I/Eco31I/Esp3I family type II restriction adenine-specific DNA-methyltransferase [Parageobacillus toebii]WMT20062.1 Alw26I/Eco31I/Esp3I family type II restriction adenine-specific DNA-methyltransferase [Parageobacillus toebii]